MGGGFWHQMAISYGYTAILDGYTGDVLWGTYTTLVYVECLWNWEPKGRTPFDFIAEPKPQVAQAAPATPAG